MSVSRHWPQLELDDERMKEAIETLLTSRVAANPYGDDSTFAAAIAPLPRGLRAMAATHWLDISLTLDSITWHFGNFGEPGLVAATEAGLIELGLHDLARCFADARDLMVPLLSQRTEADGDPYEMLEHSGLRECAEEIDKRAWELDNGKPGESVIYDAWIRYARAYPEQVFSPPPLPVSQQLPLP